MHGEKGMSEHKLSDYLVQGADESSKISIDRDLEDQQVAEYNRTKDEEIFNEIFRRRITTLRWWTHTHYYKGLAPSINDFYAELVKAFAKAVRYYKKDKGSFNTCLYTFLDNRIKNMKSNQYAKKRTPLNFTGNPSNIHVSLDVPINASESDDTLKNLIADESFENMSEINLNEMLDVLAEGDEKTKFVLGKLIENGSVTQTIRDLNTIHGFLDCSQFFDQKIEDIQKDIKYFCRYGHTKNFEKRTLFSIIENEGYGEFELKEVYMDGKTISYSIELKSTPESDLFKKKMRYFKKHKDLFMEKIFA